MQTSFQNNLLRFQRIEDGPAKPLPRPACSGISVGTEGGPAPDRPVREASEAQAPRRRPTPAQTRDGHQALGQQANGPSLEKLRLTFSDSRSGIFKVVFTGQIINDTRSLTHVLNGPLPPNGSHFNLATFHMQAPITHISGNIKFSGFFPNEKQMIGKCREITNTKTIPAASILSLLSSPEAHRCLQINNWSNWIFVLVSKL